jgi:hypothetical protein
MTAIRFVSTYMAQFRVERTGNIGEFEATVGIYKPVPIGGMAMVSADRMRFA